MKKIKPLVVGITGKAGSGKSTVADMIKDRVPESYQYAFAAPIKRAAATLFGGIFEDLGIKNSEWLEVGEFKEMKIPGFDFSPRQFMQHLGTDIARKLDPNVWIKLANDELGIAEFYHDKLFVVSDVRFDNEAEWVKRTGGLLVQVLRDNAHEVNPHSSEGGVTVVPDYILLNNTNLNDLVDQVDNLIKDIL